MHSFIKTAILLIAALASLQPCSARLTKAPHDTPATTVAKAATSSSTTALTCRVTVFNKIVIYRVPKVYEIPAQPPSNSSDVAGLTFFDSLDYHGQNALRDCQLSLDNAELNIPKLAAGTVVLEGVPDACMKFAAHLNGTVAEGNPVPQGNGTVNLENVSEDSIQQFKADILGMDVAEGA